MRFVIAAAAVVLGVASASAQTDDWQVCNETSYVMRVATGVAGGEALRVRGWDRVLPGDCEGYRAPGTAPRYVIAESHPAHQGGIREWVGDVELCAGSDDFTAEPEQSCSLQGLELRTFIRVPADEERTLLVEPSDYKSKAKVAGLQRLLRDAGYKVRRIDGLSGRGTTRELNKFRKDAGLDKGATEAEQYAALIEAAEARRDSLGLTVCNESQERIWAGMGFRRDGVWQSRGWWEVAVGACEQVSTEALSGAEPHLFALQEDTRPPEADDDELDTEDLPPRPDKRLRTVATGPSQFCISEARFAVVGREDCRDRGYGMASFRPLSLADEEDGKTVTLTDADFVAPSSTGLRR